MPPSCSTGKCNTVASPNDRGGIVDDLLVYRIDEQTYMLVVNASNIEKDWNWIRKQDEWNVEMHNISDKTSLLAVQGPLAADVLQPLTNMDLRNMEYYSFAKGVFAGIENVLVSATGYTGAGGFEVYFENGSAGKIWDAIFEAGETQGIRPIGLVLATPCGWRWVSVFTAMTLMIPLPHRSRTRLDHEVYQAIHQQRCTQAAEGRRVSRKLVGFEMIDRGIPRHDYEVRDAAGIAIGKVTSGTQSPTLNKAIGWRTSRQRLPGKVRRYSSRYATKRCARKWSRFRSSRNKGNSTVLPSR